MAYEKIRNHYFNNVFTEKWCRKFNGQFCLKLDSAAAIDVRDQLSWIAAQYKPLKDGNTGKSTYDDDKRILRNSAKSLKNSKKYLLSAFNRFECQIRFHGANAKGAQLLLNRQILDNGYSTHTDFEAIIRIIGQLAEICEAASTKEFNPPYEVSSIALEICLQHLAPCWKKHFSRIQYTEGAHYGKITKYNSDALGLLVAIFSEIDSDIEREPLATALKNTKKFHRLEQ